MLARMYRALELGVPAGIKNLIPKTWRIWLGYRIKVGRGGQLRSFDLRHRLTLPAGETRDTLFAYLSPFYVKQDGPHPERVLYLKEAFDRFLYTLMLVPRQQGTLLEIGAAPYFMTLLMKQFTDYEITLVNYFDSTWGKRASQTLVGSDGQDLQLTFDNVNVETDELPYPDDSFDVILLCEVIEHLTQDPLRAILEIKRVLKQGGTFIVTSPNVARLENMARLVAGQNIYDSYSAYGAYGRHNREYTGDELRELLRHAGFELKTMFTSDVGPNLTNTYVHASWYKRLVSDRQKELGQYIFLVARNSGPHDARKPRWLYRSYPEDQLS